MRFKIQTYSNRYEVISYRGSGGYDTCAIIEVKKTDNIAKDKSRLVATMKLERERMEMLDALEDHANNRIGAAERLAKNVDRIQRRVETFDSFEGRLIRIQDALSNLKTVDDPDGGV